MDIIKLGEAWISIMEGFQAVEEPLEQKPLLCMAIDMVAANCGMESLDLLDEMRPHIEAVNASMGRMELAGKER